MSLLLLNRSYQMGRGWSIHRDVQPTKIEQIQLQYNMSGGHHGPKLNIWAIGAMSSVAIIYGLIKSPLKNKWASEDRVSPKADLAWRNASQKWLDKQE